jgi:hypothetical protein
MGVEQKPFASLSSPGGIRMSNFSLPARDVSGEVLGLDSAIAEPEKPLDEVESTAWKK